MSVTYEWRGTAEDREVELLHAQGFEHPPRPVEWSQQLRDHSLGWVCARSEGRLVGFVNVAWDGGVHAFLLDTVVAAGERSQGIGRELVASAASEAAAAGCQWLHVDFEEPLRQFYIAGCGFGDSPAGVMRLPD